MYTIQDLFDLSHTRAAAYLAAFTYPWEALAGISDLIRRLGPALGEARVLNAAHAFQQDTQFHTKMPKGGAAQ